MYGKVQDNDLPMIHRPTWREKLFVYEYYVDVWKAERTRQTIPFMNCKVYILNVYSFVSLTMTDILVDDVLNIWLNSCISLLLS